MIIKYQMDNIVTWIKKTGKNINVNIFENVITIDYLNITSKLLKPTNLRKYYMITSATGNNYDFYDLLNLYCLKKYPSEVKLISKLIDYIDKHNGIQLNNLRASQTDDFKYHETVHYEMRSNLKKIAKTSCGYLSTTERHVSSIYNKKIVSDILIDEFMEIWRLSQLENKLYIKLLNNNIYTWEINILKVNNKDLNNYIKRTSNPVTVQFYFHELLYPNYPPIVKICGCKLLNSLSHKISNSKMTQLDYWVPSRSTMFILNRIIHILNKWGEVEHENLLLSTAEINMNDHLTHLSSVICSVDEYNEIDSDYNFSKFKFTELQNIQQTSTTSTNINYWNKGTGYGHNDNDSQWNPDEYNNLQNTKDLHIQQSLNTIANYIKLFTNDIDSIDDFCRICDVINSSLLIRYISNQFKSTTILEMKSRESFFITLIDIINLIATEHTMHLFKPCQNHSGLYSAIKKIYVISKESIKIDNDCALINAIICTYEELLYPIYDKQCIVTENHESLKSVPDEDINDVNIDDENKRNEEIYIKAMNDMRFDYTNIVDSNYHLEYKIELLSKQHIDWKKCKKRLSAEIPSLMEFYQLPVTYDSSILLRVDENYPMAMRSLIIGPKNTPYENGCFIFDIFMTELYPTVFKNCWFKNTGNNRLNPNLYEKGKVCLSLLGTWNSGSKSEEWNENTSSLLQVLISIQSQILIEQPFFNEPSHEKIINTASGKSQSDDYNNTVRYYVMCSSIRDFVVNPALYPQFEKPVRFHFKHKKTEILQSCQSWVDNATVRTKPNFVKVYNEINEAINLL